ncbi:hypothetical protein DET61_10510 [Marinobacter nauticus]|uniref:Uncharacterized protein n=1 Tax=Marinobacter nauticus TaxID=2743 RepID=A0A368XQN7_MARNT|nr:hypothetical protein DET61_10510 [Marinobacter nauticus]
MLRSSTSFCHNKKRATDSNPIGRAIIFKGLRENAGLFCLSLPKVFRAFSKAASLAYLNRTTSSCNSAAIFSIFSTLAADCAPFSKFTDASEEMLSTCSLI